MSFNKRFLSRESIVNFAKTSEFNEFNSYLTKPDAIIFMDDWASDFWKSYTKLEEVGRQGMYKVARGA